MRNLDIADTRDKLMTYAKAGLLGSGTGTAMLRLDDPRPTEASLAAPCASAWRRPRAAPRRRPVHVTLAALLALAMSLHWMRGFRNPVQFAGEADARTPRH